MENLQVSAENSFSVFGSIVIGKLFRFLSTAFDKLQHWKSWNGN